jgi:Mg2+/Co2+ transporter CorC
MIVIEKDQTPLQILDCELHEALHMRYPEIPEDAVTKMGTYLAKFLWKLKYRKT